MKKATLIRWAKPDALANWEREQNKHKPGHLALLVLKCSLLLCVLTLGAVYHWAPEELERVAGLIILVCLFAPVQHYFSMRGLYVNTEETYELREDGLLYVGPGVQPVHPWKKMCSYKISDHPHVAGVKVIDFEMKALDGSKLKRRCTYAPSEVDEEKLKAIIESSMT